jgi:hypothetical protein
VAVVYQNKLEMVKLTENKDCPYLIGNFEGLNKFGTCKLTDDICPLIRYCTTKNAIVSSDLFFLNGCKVKNDKER